MHRHSMPADPLTAAVRRSEAKRAAAEMQQQQQQHAVTRAYSEAAGQRALAAGQLVSVEVVKQTREWSDGDSSDDEAGAAPVRVASERLGARESRILAAAPLLESSAPIGDVDIEVVTQSTEWSGDGGAFDSDAVADGSGEEMAARRSFAAREHRLSLRASLKQQDAPLCDAEIEIQPQPTEWRGGDADSDDDAASGPAASQRMARHASDAYESREKRLRSASQALNREVSMADTDIVVVAQQKEWAASKALDAADSDGISSDEEPMEQMEKVKTLATNTYNAREERIAMAERTLREEQPRGDSQVEVVPSMKEWASARSVGVDHNSSDEEGSATVFHRIASTRSDAREKRLSMAQQWLQSDAPMGDTEVEVIKEPRDWAALNGAADDERESPESLRVHARASLTAREQRLSRAAEAMRRPSLLGDAEVEVVQQAREWEGAGGHDSSGDEQGGAAMAVQRRASERASVRDRRLEEAARRCDGSQQLGDKEVEVVGVAREWSERVPDSDSGDDDPHDSHKMDVRVRRTLSKRNEGRERRLSDGDVMRKLSRPMGDQEVEVHTQQKEWAGAGSDSEDDDQRVVRVASDSYAAREARLSRVSQSPPESFAPQATASSSSQPAPAPAQYYSPPAPEAQAAAEVRAFDIEQPGSRRGTASGIDAYHVGSNRCAERCSNQCSIS
eukprot:TRINITY_DN20566_c0_g1_i1.p1 TRINITY_DN20566_c0_g1~~TRINITY_DN20566_c0_g1_i1.p1  ORF type:complete len:678 (+),score=205.98 TRINITY_DN20566_c0_g1_i1:64-2097(+)